MSNPPLACGRTSDYLLELVADEAVDGPVQAAAQTDRADLAHLAGCRYCTAEAARLRARWARVPAAARAPVEVPVALVSRTLATLGAIRGGPTTGHLEIEQAGGTLRVPDRVVAVLVRELARDLLGELCRRGGLPDAACRVLAVAGEPHALTVQVALPYGGPLRELAEQLRVRLAGALHDQLSGAAPTVSINVTEVSQITGP
ncbi:MAG: hypothetical protein ACT4O0_07645 [Pseudonocardia sp.]